MSRGTRIIAIGQASDTPSEPEAVEMDAIPDTSDDEIDEWQAEYDEIAASVRGGWLAPSLAVSAIVGWTAFFAWANLATIRALPTPTEWTALASSWASPVLLIAVFWLLAMRSSSRETARFGDAARLLSAESADLETRLVIVNRELSLAREFLAAQARDLEALGRIAVERLSQNAGTLQGLIEVNGSRIDAIGDVSQVAVDNMEKLRGQLPVIASSAKDVTNHIANAGRTAHAQLAEMVEGFKRINEFGRASETQVVSLRGMVNEAIGEFANQAQQLETIAAERFAALAERGAEFRTQMDGQEIEALAAIRTRASALAEELAETRHSLDGQEEESLTSLRARLSALRDEGGTISRALREGETRALDSWQDAVSRLESELAGKVEVLAQAQEQALEAARARLTSVADESAMIEAAITERLRIMTEQTGHSRDNLAEVEKQALDALAGRLSAFDNDLAERRTAHERHTAALTDIGEAMAVKLSAFEQRLELIVSGSTEAQDRISESLQGLGTHLEETRTALAGTGAEIDTLTDGSVRLLELIQASALHSRTELPEGLTQSEARLTANEARAMALRDLVLETGRGGERIAETLSASTGAVRSAMAEIDALHVALDAQGDHQTGTLDALRRSIAETRSQSELLATSLEADLSGAVEKLNLAASKAISAIESGGSVAIDGLSAKLRTESAGAIERALRESTADSAGQIQAAALQAASASHETVSQFRDQLAKVAELVGNLEQRVTHARERAEEQVDNDFSRRAGLITDSLNSNAIDIAKALSTDVSDTAWAAYLRGDRSVFTRRAVSLLENNEAREVAQIYDRDHDFREHVSRYVHDFEAILREVLATRDGHALGVTLLSSDMGKLYVALAQAIERLRT